MRLRDTEKKYIIYIGSNLKSQSCSFFELAWFGCVGFLGYSVFLPHQKSYMFGYLKILLTLLLAWSLNWTWAPGIGELIYAPMELGWFKGRDKFIHGVKKSISSLYPIVNNQISAQSDHTGISSSDTQKISSLTIGCTVVQNFNSKLTPTWLLRENNLKEMVKLRFCQISVKYDSLADTWDWCTVMKSLTLNLTSIFTGVLLLTSALKSVQPHKQKGWLIICRPCLINVPPPKSSQVAHNTSIQESWHAGGVTKA